MDRRTAFLPCLLLLLAPRACLTKLPPPKHVEVKSSILSWKPPLGVIGVTYSVQYSTVAEQEWHNVCGCNQAHFNLTSFPEDLYGRIFRVRAETSNQTSDWITSDKVQCQHIGTCAPLFNLTVQTGKVHLWMGHKDQTLSEEYGGHIIFRALYWKETRPNDKKELNSRAKTLTIEGLEFGKKYCFQVVYLVYSKFYGNSSLVQCDIIPISPEQENLHIIILGVLVVAGLFVFGMGLYFVYKNYRKVKLFLQPPLDIPVHIQKFFSEEFPHQELVCHGSPELESNDLVIFILEESEEEKGNRSDATESVCLS